MTIDTALPHLHAIELPTPFPVGPITVYLAAAPGEPLTLVDTGPHTPAAIDALHAALADLGHHPSALQRILVTHTHADHFGLAAHLVAGSGAHLLTHPWNVAPLTDYDTDRQQRRSFYTHLLLQAGLPADRLADVGRATRGVDRFARPVAVHRTLDEGDSLDFAGRPWRVLHTPGHAAGLICLYDPASRSLLSSDHLLADISSNPVVEPPPPGHDRRLRSLLLYRQSLQRVAALDIARAFPSHGPVVHDVAALVARRLAFHEHRAARVLDALRPGPRTTWQITQELFPQRAPLDVFLAISEVIGHLDLLEVQGLVHPLEENDVVHWHL